MKTLCHTARAVARDVPGLDRKFRMPYTRVNQRQITVARTMAHDAAPYIDRFVAHGLPATFPADLTAAADTFATAIQDHAAAKEARAAATVGITDAIAKGVAAAKQLDPIVKNVLAGNAGQLAAWKSARHVSLLGLTSAPATPEPAPQTA